MSLLEIDVYIYIYVYRLQSNVSVLYFNNFTPIWLNLIISKSYSFCQNFDH